MKQIEKKLHRIMKKPEEGQKENQDTYNGDILFDTERFSFTDWEWGQSERETERK
jgi:hypothetical protein